jgi:hypothetical protein
VEVEEGETRGGAGPEAVADAVTRAALLALAQRVAS